MKPMAINPIVQAHQILSVPAIACEKLHSPLLPLLNRPALNGVDCAVPAGDFVAILGLNGAGKSTLLRSLVGLVPIQSGGIAINGVALQAQTMRQRRDVSMLFQGGGLVPQLTALENVLCGCLGVRSPWQTLWGFPLRDRQRALQLLTELGLATQRDQQTSQLSGGQQQRVAIARVLMQSPKILLVDEPITGLDMLAAKQVMDIFAKLNHEGMTIVAVLHDLAIAADYAKRAIVLDAGRVIYQGDCQNLPDQISRINS
jgi:phosphonate transport system ATP-binding protein